MPTFIKGLDLSEQYYEQCVRPVIERAFPGLPYAAALIGDGSEVLGYDTVLSTDHGWGPRVQLFLTAEDYTAYRNELGLMLGSHLPTEFLGYPTDMGDYSHRRGIRGVETLPLRGFFLDYLGINPLGELAAPDWLVLPEAKLLGVTAGRVFHDGPRELTAARRKLAYYPHDVWLYLMASQWSYISEERAFMGRCGDAGDELGSRLVASRLVTYLMRLCFLQEKRYTPYAKWFGTAFAGLGCASGLATALMGALRAEGWREREGFLCEAYSLVAERHNGLGVTEPVEAHIDNYYTRPYRVIDSDAFAEALLQKITDPVLKALPHPIGSISQFSICTPMLCDTILSAKAQVFYTE